MSRTSRKPSPNGWGGIFLTGLFVIIATIIGVFLTYRFTVRSVQNDTVELLSLRFDVVETNMRYDEALATIYNEYQGLRSLVAILENENEQLYERMRSYSLLVAESGNRQEITERLDETRPPEEPNQVFLQEMMTLSFTRHHRNSDIYAWNQPGEAEMDNTGASYDNALGFRLAGYGETWLQAEYFLNQQFSLFEATYVLNSISRNRTGSYVLSIYLDDRRVYTTSALTAGALPIGISIDVTGATKIGFRVTGSNRGSAINPWNTHLALADAVFHK